MAVKPSNQTTGRTPWDFATAVLMQLGPTTVVVIGVLGSAYFLYTEINRARLKADKQLQDSLASAQAQLVNNTKKMGDMSEKLIANIDNMLELSKRVDKEVDESRERYEKQLKAIRTEMESSTQALLVSKRQVKDAQAEIARLTEELDTKHAEIMSLEGTHKKLSVEVARLRDEKEKLQGSTQEYARQVGELKEKQPHTLGDVVERVMSDSVAMKAVRDQLAEFVNDPRSADGRKVAESLIGLRAEILENVVKDDGAGFKSWFYIAKPESQSRTLFGYVKTNPAGPQDILVIGIANNRVFLANALAENFLFEMPTAENWYDDWLCNIAIGYGEGFEQGYYDFDIDKWDQVLITGGGRSRGSIESGVLFGEIPSFDLTTIDAFKQNFPMQYELWSRQNDAYGRARLILAMMARAEGFEATEIDGMSQAEFPDGLRDFVVQVLNASVRDNTAFLKSVVGPYVGRNDLGAVAAMALREGFQVDQVVKRQSAMQQAAAPEEFEVQFSLDAIAAAKERDQARLTFRRTAANWQLGNVTAPF